MKRRLKPLQTTMLDHHHIKATRRPLPPVAQIMLGSKHDPLLFAPVDAGQRAAMALIGPTSHLDEHHRPAGLAHNQVYLAAAATRCAVIAHQQLQSAVLQIGQGLVLSVIPKLFGGSQRCMLKGAN